MVDWRQYAPKIDLPPAPELSKLEFVDFTVSDIKAMSNEELLAVLSGEHRNEGIVSPGLQQLVATELHARGFLAASRPHWSVVPSFWLLVATAILALVAAVAAVVSLPQVQHMLGP